LSRNLKEAAKWIEDMSKNDKKMEILAANSKAASAYFTRDNADKFVQLYFKS